jgi:type IV pilus assembly protein PilC
MFAGFGATLPQPTQLVILISNFIKNYFFLLLALIIFVVLGGRLADKNMEPVNRLRTWLIVRIPLIGKIYVFSASEHFLRTTAFMMESGESLPNAMKAAAAISDKRFYSNGLIRLQEKLLNGNSLADALEEEGLFPKQVTRAAAIGDRTGKLNSLFFHLANQYKIKGEETRKRLVKSIEPALMIILGIIIGAIVIAIYLPIFKIGEMV